MILFFINLLLFKFINKHNLLYCPILKGLTILKFGYWFCILKIMFKDVPLVFKLYQIKLKPL